ncbi:MAG: hypothetical protein HOM84_07440 [Thiotrichales bacterium]|jgi:hypothetical protein|nr:hypothetical protein [Thiotrichales bacterium]MBT3613799.1 hypothetical protein [Thiotrichales bacterium]MBT3753239.1 hypothetical protein [Thiotrichales bacterium]MBT3837856.1 hypothetical protein [Thiotrichales bacterium]MBT4152091.1 hypothetical protein [Thiotrichales bacterium]
MDSKKDEITQDEVVQDELNGKTEEECKAAKRPHELFVINLIFFHLLAVPAGIVSGYGYWVMLLPIISTTALRIFYRLRVNVLSSDNPELGNSWLAEHWESALHRFRWLYLGYAIVALLLATIVAIADPDSILFVALTRVAVMPVIIIVLITFVISTAAIGKAGRGE